MTDDLFSIFHISILMLIACAGAVLRVNIHKRRYFASFVVIVLFTGATILLIRNLYNVDVVFILSGGVALGYFIFYTLYNLFKNEKKRTEKLQKELSETDQILIDMNTEIISDEKLREAIADCANKVDNPEPRKEDVELFGMLMELQMRRRLDLRK